MKKLLLLSISVLIFSLFMGLGMAAAQEEEPSPPVQQRTPIMVVEQPVPTPVGTGATINLSVRNNEWRWLPNLPIQIYIDGEQIRRARTDVNGQASIRLPADLPLGEHEAVVEFIGTEAYKSVRDTVIILVRPIEVTIQTIPPLKGVSFILAGQTITTGEDGSARLELEARGEYDLEVIPIPNNYVNDETHAEFQRWSDSVFEPQRTMVVHRDNYVEAGYIISHRVQQKFYDLQGNPVPEERIETLTLKTSTGDFHTFDDGQYRWLRSTRINRNRTGLEATAIMYSVESVMIDGANTVNRYQQKFFVEPEDTWNIELLMYHAQITARDALYGFTVGHGIIVEYPDGHTEYVPYEEDKKIRIGPLARGDYKVRPAGVTGMIQMTPLALSRDQDVALKALTTFDIVTSVSAGVIGAFGLLFYGRPWLMFLPWRSLRLGWGLLKLGWRSRRWQRVLGRGALLLLLGAMLLAQFLMPLPKAAAQLDVNDPIPMMAYYYIWFTESSWNRAKTDYPTLGRYSSDDPDIMRQHIDWAQEAGIDGFIVSWKSTFQLDPRLEMLMDIAAAEGFQLWIIYQGLDFDRNPLPIAQIDRDLQYFLERYAAHPAFEMYDRPVVIWSGTWEFSREEIEAVTGMYRDQLYILASERNTPDYLDIADLVDGNAYYWSSVDPQTFPNYQEKLTEMGEAIHKHGGIWVAPAAPGFDARLIGGTRAVERLNGATLRTQLNVALRSNPDVIGLISWNEFSENSHVEPSENYGRMALDVLMGREVAAAPVIMDFDSSDPGTTNQDSLYSIWVLGAAFTLAITSVIVVIVRRLHSLALKE